MDRKIVINILSEYQNDFENIFKISLKMKKMFSVGIKIPSGWTSIKKRKSLYYVFSGFQNVFQRKYDFENIFKISTKVKKIFQPTSKCFLCKLWHRLDIQMRVTDTLSAYQKLIRWAVILEIWLKFQWMLKMLSVGIKVFLVYPQKSSIRWKRLTLERLTWIIELRKKIQKGLSRQKRSQCLQTFLFIFKNRWIPFFKFFIVQNSQCSRYWRKIEHSLIPKIILGWL